MQSNNIGTKAHETRSTGRGHEPARLAHLHDVRSEFTAANGRPDVRGALRARAKEAGPTIHP